MSRFVLAPAAREDVDDIWEYIAADNPDAADRFIEKLYTNIVKLANAPGMGHSREDLAEGRSLLFWPVGNYLILYRVARQHIEIAAIAHGKRDIPAFIRRRGI